MTVITKPLSQQEKEKKDEVNGTSLEEVSLSGEGKIVIDVESGNEGKVSVITASTRPKRSQSSHMCLILVMLLAISLGLTILGYYQFHRQLKPSSYRGSCRLPCHMKRQQQKSFCPRKSRMFQNNGPPIEVLAPVPPKDGAAFVLGDIPGDGDFWRRNTEEKPLVKTEIDLQEIRETETDIENDDGTFEMRYELDLEHETFELIQMPDVSSGTYIHDFTVNRTAIIEENRCFVLVMDRTEISPPRNLMEVILNTAKDGYELDLDEIQHDLMIVPPKLTTDQIFKEYGLFIGKICNGRTTYKLEPVPEPIASLKKIEDLVEDEVEDFNALRKKRAAKSPKMFKEISNKFITYNIVNFDTFEE